MQAKIAYIILAVNDLEKSVRFYRDGLGWTTEGITGRQYHDDVTGAEGTIAFFHLEDGLLLGLYERQTLAKDAGVPLDPWSRTEFSLGVMARSQADVDHQLAAAQAAGATLTAPPHRRPFGVYSGYFTDPDGHLWEIAWDASSA